jgi:hypothetical protein
MKKSGWGFIIVALILFLTIIGRMAIRVSANDFKAANQAEQDEIKRLSMLTSMLDIVP